MILKALSFIKEIEPPCFHPYKNHFVTTKTLAGIITNHPWTKRLIE